MNNRTKILAALAFLFSIVGTVENAFSAELRDLIRTKKVRLVRHTMIVRKNVTNASNTVHLIDAETIKKHGVSTISKKALPKNMAVVFDKIGISLVEGDAAGKEAGMNYSDDSTPVPAAMRNANLVIVQNNREILDVAVLDLLKGEVTETSDGFYHDLEGFNYLHDEEDMDIFFRMPDGQTLAPSVAGKHWYVELRAKGWKTLKVA